MTTPSEPTVSTLAISQTADFVIDDDVDVVATSELVTELTRQLAIAQVAKATARAKATFKAKEMSSIHAAFNAAEAKAISNKEATIAAGAKVLLQNYDQFCESSDVLHKHAEEEFLRFDRSEIEKLIASTIKGLTMQKEGIDKQLLDITDAMLAFCNVKAEAEGTWMAAMTAAKEALKEANRVLATKPMTKPTTKPTKRARTESLD